MSIDSGMPMPGRGEGAASSEESEGDGKSSSQGSLDSFSPMLLESLGSIGGIGTGGGILMDDLGGDAAQHQQQQHGNANDGPSLPPLDEANPPSLAAFARASCGQVVIEDSFMCISGASLDFARFSSGGDEDQMQASSSITVLQEVLGGRGGGMCGDALPSAPLLGAQQGSPPPSLGSMGPSLGSDLLSRSMSLGLTDSTPGALGEDEPFIPILDASTHFVAPPPLQPSPPQHVQLQQQQQHHSQQQQQQQKRSHPPQSRPQQQTHQQEHQQQVVMMMPPPPPPSHQRQQREQAQGLSVCATRSALQRQSQGVADAASGPGAPQHQPPRHLPIAPAFFHPPNPSILAVGQYLTVPPPAPTPTSAKSSCDGAMPSPHSQLAPPPLPCTFDPVTKQFYTALPSILPVGGRPCPPPPPPLLPTPIPTANPPALAARGRSGRAPANVATGDEALVNRRVADVNAPAPKVSKTEENSPRNRLMPNSPKESGGQEKKGTPRGSYRCGLCGGPKRNHVCPLRADKATKESATQVDKRLTCGNEKKNPEFPPAPFRLMDIRVPSTRMLEYQHQQQQDQHPVKAGGGSGEAQTTEVN